VGLVVELGCTQSTLPTTCIVHEGDVLDVGKNDVIEPPSAGTDDDAQLTLNV